MCVKWPQNGTESQGKWICKKGNFYKKKNHLENTHNAPNKLEKIHFWKTKDCWNNPWSPAVDNFFITLMLLVVLFQWFCWFFLPAPITTHLWLLSGPWNGPAKTFGFVLQTQNTLPWSMELLSVSIQAGTQVRLCRINSQFMISSSILSEIPALPGMQAVASPVLRNKFKPKQIPN